MDINIHGEPTDKHWENAIKTFKRRIGWIKYLTKAHPITPKNARMLLNLSAKPVLEYSLQVFFPENKKLCSKIEKLSLASAASVEGLCFYTKTETKRLLLGMEPFECRRDQLKMNFWNKIITSPDSSLSVLLAKEALRTKSKTLSEWLSLTTKYNINLKENASIQILADKDVKLEIKQKIQRFWIEKDLKELQNPNKQLWPRIF